MHEKNDKEKFVQSADKCIEYNYKEKFQLSKNLFLTILDLKLQVNSEILFKIDELTLSLTHAKIFFLYELLSLIDKKISDLLGKHQRDTKNERFLLFLYISLNYRISGCSENDFKNQLSVVKKFMDIYGHIPELCESRAQLLSECYTFFKTHTSMKQESFHFISKALSEDPDNTYFLDSAAHIYMNFDEFSTARAKIRQALMIEPKNPELRWTADLIESKEIFHASYSDYESKLKETTRTLKKIQHNVDSIKLDFVVVLSIFVVFVTASVKVVSMSYENFQGLDFFELVKYSIGLSFPWLIIMCLLIILILRLAQNKST